MDDGVDAQWQFELADTSSEIEFLLEYVDADAFTMVEMPGKVLDPETFRLAPRRIADSLLARTAVMNQRGVFHLDLRQRQNILLGQGLELSIIDFGAGWAPNPLARWIFGGLLTAVDRSAALKYLARFAPEHLTREEGEEVLRGISIEDEGEFLSDANPLGATLVTPTAPPPNPQPNPRPSQSPNANCCCPIPPKKKTC